MPMKLMVPRKAGSARTLARRQARQLMVVRKRTQPTAVYIARLTATATVAYLMALLVPLGASRPVLAPLTALLVLQASMFQTIRSGIRKVVSVTAGVLAAVTVSSFVGFSWWLLGLLIAGTLVLGALLRLGDDLLEVPISAMLIFASAGEHTAATGRIVDTLIGTAAGLAGGLVFAPLRVQPAREAVSELASRLAGLLDGMAGDLAGQPEQARIAHRLDQARALRGEIERVDDALRQAEESVRLNPRTLRTLDGLTATEGGLRGGLETLEHAALAVRMLARSLLDSIRAASDASPVREEQTRDQLTSVLSKLAEAIRTYGTLQRTLPTVSESLESRLEAQLAEAHQQQDLLAAMLEPRTGTDGESTEWPLRGEILSHVDRLRTGLRVEMPELPRRRARRPRRAARAPRRRRRSR
jgi:Fusaric acid resistance protein-like